MKKLRIIAILLATTLMLGGCVKHRKDDDVSFTTTSIETQVEQIIPYPMTFSSTVQQEGTFTYDVLFPDVTIKSIDKDKVHVSDGLNAELTTAIGADASTATFMLKDIVAEPGTYLVSVDAGAISFNENDLDNTAFSFEVMVYSNTTSPYVTVSMISSGVPETSDEPLIVTIRYTGVSGDYLDMRLDNTYFEFTDCTGDIDSITRQSKSAMQIVSIMNFAITGANPSITLKEGSAYDMEGNPVVGSKLVID